MLFYQFSFYIFSGVGLWGDGQGIPFSLLPLLSPHSLSSPFPFLLSPYPNFSPVSLTFSDQISFFSHPFSPFSLSAPSYFIFIFFFQIFKRGFFYFLLFTYFSLLLLILLYLVTPFKWCQTWFTFLLRLFTQGHRWMTSYHMTSTCSIQALCHHHEDRKACTV